MDTELNQPSLLSFADRLPEDPTPEQLDRLIPPLLRYLLQSGKSGYKGNIDDFIPTPSQGNGWLFAGDECKGFFIDTQADRILRFTLTASGDSWDRSFQPAGGETEEFEETMRDKPCATGYASEDDWDKYEYADGKYSAIDFVPPKDVQETARRGLELRKEWGRGGLSNKEASEQGIGSGVARATTLANGKTVSPDTISQMVRFFSRHQKNFQPDKKELDGGSTAGTIADYLWGGPPGERWCNKVKRQMDAADADTADHAESKIRFGTTVSWKWQSGTATGKVIKIYSRSITLKLGDSEVTRNGSEDDPALLIEQENGARALKLKSEVGVAANYEEEGYAIALSELEFAATAKKRNCTPKSTPCGNTCISKDKVCRKEIKPELKTKAKELKARLKNNTQTPTVESNFESAAYDSKSKRELDSWTKFNDQSKGNKGLADNAEIVGLIRDEVNKNNFVGVKDKQGRLQAAATVADKGDHIYVDYLATAPWNIAGNDKRSVKGAGSAAMEAIVRKSLDAGHGGAVQLESLEGAVGFYQKVGFTEKRRKNVFGTIFIEMELSSDAAQEFLNKRGKK